VYTVDENNGGQYPGGEYEGEHDATGMMPIRRMAGRTMLVTTAVGNRR